MMLLLLKYLRILLFILFRLFKSPLRLSFENILKLIVNKAINGLSPPLVWSFDFVKHQIGRDGWALATNSSTFKFTHDLI